MQRKLNLSQIVLIVVAIALLASNAFLIFQNSQLRSELEQSKQFVTDVGYKFSGLTSRSLDGKDESLTFSEVKKRTLLLVFSTSCNYCLQQYPYWKELIKNIDHEEWRIVAITSEVDQSRIKEHIEENGLNNISIGLIPAEEMRKARLLYTPMTLLVNADGEVRKVWPGLWAKGFDLQD